MKHLSWSIASLAIFSELNFISLTNVNAYQPSLPRQNFLPRLHRPKPLFDNHVQQFYDAHNLTNASSKIEYLVFSGGGAKGIGNPGAYQALYDSGILEGIKSVAGSSVGALTAALIAVGIDPVYFRSEMLQVDMDGLVNTLVFKGPNIIPGITSSAKPLEWLLNRLLTETTYGFLKNQRDMPVDVMPIFEKISTQHHELTFGELYTLHLAFPTQFKQLYIPAVAFGKERIDVFDRNNKNISIAKACLASAAIPGKFAPVKINDTYYQDAVLINSLPVNYFAEQNTVSKTLLFLFENPAWHEVIYNNTDYFWKNYQSEINRVDSYYVPLINFFLINLNIVIFLFKALNFLLMLPIHLLSNEITTLNESLVELLDIFSYLCSKPLPFNQRLVANNVFMTLRNHYSNQTILLGSGRLGTTSFSLAQKNAETLHAIYYLDTMEFLLKKNIYIGNIFKNEYDFYTTIVNGYEKELMTISNRTISLKNTTSPYAIYQAIINATKIELSSNEADALKKTTDELIVLHQRPNMSTHINNSFFAPTKSTIAERHNNTFLLPKPNID